MVFYVQMWGPLWAWSCFPFEDWNSALLQSVHGTGDVTKQCFRLREVQLKLNSLDISSFAETAVQFYLGEMKTQGRLWFSGKSIGKVYVAGRLQNVSDLSENTLQFILEKTNAQEMGHIN